VRSGLITSQLTLTGCSLRQSGRQRNERSVNDTGILVLLRHGESTANAAGLFTGVLDPPLSERGEREARTAAALLAGARLVPDAVFTSSLLRARQTTEILGAELHLADGAWLSDWRLNERNYGALTGLSKEHVRTRFGEAQFRAWRRSVHTAPPPMNDELFERLRDTDLFRALPPQALARTEALSEVIERVAAFHADRVTPILQFGRTVLVVAHGNSLRAYCARLDGLDDHAIHRLNLPTGHPLVYRFDRTVPPDTRDRAIPPGGTYLDPATALAAAAALTNDGGT
jgi:2,3-bisphosphoglycerate-dependent phosphoglycerate mutase